MVFRNILRMFSDCLKDWTTDQCPVRVCQVPSLLTRTSVYSQCHNIYMQRESRQEISFQCQPIRIHAIYSLRCQWQPGHPIYRLVLLAGASKTMTWRWYRSHLLHHVSWVMTHVAIIGSSSLLMMSFISTYQPLCGQDGKKKTTHLSCSTECLRPAVAGLPER